MFACTDEARWRLGSGYVGIAARQQGVDDSEGVRIKYSLHPRPNTHRAPSCCSHPALRKQNNSRRPLAVGTLEVHFLLLFESLSHPSFAAAYSSVAILLTDLSSACPCLLCCGKNCGNREANINIGALAEQPPVEEIKCKSMKNLAQSSFEPRVTRTTRQEGWKGEGAKANKARTNK